ncbi:hypothetical protein LOK74_01550 [Brevibacillus humidisoli]|uniref:hypothetical protein n=1 Tax=Brevibacillus humidisoli TaxID=2895522 RepID=UPI001E4809FC|nr:hypothetical protein [Brevibacillus humidisoli]UFJ41263.1 hypothetical protein LOK74_01550 [Brevibacillus humidisoli]
MGPTRLRYTMIGFIVGVVIVYLEALPTGVRFAAPFYGAGLGLLIDNMIVRIKQKRGKDE